MFHFRLIFHRPEWLIYNSLMATQSEHDPVDIVRRRRVCLAEVGVGLCVDVRLAVCVHVLQ
jgi:hypothetical protein